MKKYGFNALGRRCGETHWRAKFTDEEVEAVLFLRAAGLSFAAIAAKWDEDGRTMSKSTARDICSGARRATWPVAYRAPRKRS